MDLRITMRRCPREVTAEESKAVLDSLQAKGFRLLLSSANRAYLDALGMSGLEATGLRQTGLHNYSSGDLIACDDWSELVYLGHKTTTRRQPGARPSLAAPKIKESTLTLGSICTIGESSLLEPLRLAVCDALSIDPSERWPRLIWQNKAFDELEGKSTYKRANFSTEEVAAANGLCDSSARALCRSIKAAGSMLVKDLPRLEASVEDASRQQALGLLTQQHVLMCRKTSGMVLQLAAVEKLNEIDDKGVRCPFCARKPSEERLEQLLVPTDLCRAVLDHSRWMASILVSALEELDIASSRVLLEFQERSEEVDAFVDVEGELVMVELKDKEFSMGQAYPLSARIGLFHPKHVVIVTADKLAPEVKEFFGQLKPETALKYVEGLDHLKPELSGLINGIRSENVGLILENFKGLTMSADIASLICAKMGITRPEKTGDSFGDYVSLGSTFPAGFGTGALEE